MIRVDIVESVHCVLYIRKARKKTSTVRSIAENKSPFTREMICCFIRKYLPKGLQLRIVIYMKKRLIRALVAAVATIALCISCHYESNAKIAYIDLLAIHANMMFSLLKKTIINVHAYVKMTIGIPGFRLMIGFVPMEKQNETSIIHSQHETRKDPSQWSLWKL